MPNPLASKPCNQYTPSRQMIAGSDFNNVTSQLNSSQVIAAAAVGGGKANAIQINAANVVVTAVATAADSIKLPIGFDGLEITIVNDAAANSMQVFGSGTDTINDVATGTGVAQAAQTMAKYKCMVGSTAAVPAARWFRILGAAF